jgi:hypothetical protein
MNRDFDLHLKKRDSLAKTGMAGELLFLAVKSGRAGSLKEVFAM